MARKPRTFSAFLAEWNLGSSCTMPTLVLESSCKRLRRAAVQAPTDTASNIRCNRRSRTDLPIDFTPKRNEGDAVLNFHVLAVHLRIRCLEESGANQRHRRGREMETASEHTRARHEWTSLVSTPGQDGVKNIVVVNLVRRASCLNSCALVR